MLSVEYRAQCSKNYLEHVQALQLSIKLLRDEIEFQRNILEPTAIQFEEKITGSRPVDTMTSGIDQLLAMIQNFTSELAYYVQERQECHDLLNLLEPLHCFILTAFYFHGKNCLTIARDLSYSDRNIRRLRNAALDAFYDMLPLEWK